MKIKQFDERQIQIRGKVFFHGFITAVALLLINAFFQSYDVIWASGFHQNVLILMAIVTVVSVESILRGAYFDSEPRRRMVIGIFGIISLILLAFSVFHIIQGEALIENGRLTDNGFSLAFAVMVTAITLVGIVNELIERRKSEE